jgi:hypothetical protein
MGKQKKGVEVKPEMSLYQRILEEDAGYMGIVGQGIVSSLEKQKNKAEESEENIKKYFPNLLLTLDDFKKYFIPRERKDVRVLTQDEVDFLSLMTRNVFFMDGVQNILESTLTQLSAERIFIEKICLHEWIIKVQPILKCNYYNSFINESDDIEYCLVATELVKENLHK